MTNEFAFNEQKLREIVLHTVWQCGSDLVGQVKLHKVCYFLDMIFYVASGRPSIGATYRKRPHGPTCEQLPRTLRWMETCGDIRIDEVSYYGFTKKHFEPIRKADLSAFGNVERNLLDDVIEFVCKRNTAKDISEISHQLPWEMTAPGDIIPYESAFLLFPAEEPSGDAFAGFEEGLSEIEKARSNGQPLAVRPFREFRETV